MPRTGIWQPITVLTTGSGMLFVTLSVSYTLSVLDAITQKRSFASGVNGLGMQSSAFVQTAWIGEEFDGLDLLLNTYISQLNTLTSNHKAYPVLHYFYSPQNEQAPVVSITILDESLTIFRFGIPEEHRPNELMLKNARASVQTYLEMLQSAFIQPADQPPAPPDLDTLRESGIPTVSDKEFAEALDGLTDRSRFLVRTILMSVWSLGPQRPMGGMRFMTTVMGMICPAVSVLVITPAIVPAPVITDVTDG